MAPVSTWAALAAVASFGRVALAQTCDSYGVDFQSGGSYFQNISSTAPFTFVSIFEGCEDDVANNILVDPTGDEYQCTDTDLTPPDTDQLSTCPIDKDEMYSGDWSVVIISNNGNGTPIAYERDFYLSVGVPATVTYTPTVTLSSTTTPIVNSTTTTTDVVSTTVDVTVTDAAVTKKATTTVTPKKVTVTKTKTMATVSKIHYTVIPEVIIQTHTASCHVPLRQQHPDPKCSITPTLVKAAALETSKAHARDVGRSVPLDREQRIAERKAAIAERGVIEKRSPDNATTTVTDLNTADYVTTTTTSTAAASTLYITAVATATSTVTDTSTVYRGVTSLARVTVTKPTPTTTKTKYTVATVTVGTKTFWEQVRVTKTVVPAGQSAICQAKGGKMW